MNRPWFAKKKKVKSGNKEQDETDRLIKTLDEEFSRFIRLRDCNNDGYGRCVTCTHYDHWTKMQCGHFMSRAHMATRYDEKNSSMQCGGCNGPKSGKQFDHGLALDKRWGHGTAMKMKILSLTTRHWFPFELKAAISYYRNEVKRLKEEKGFA
jgi:hypothetical protein